jgi:hypothetical protein
MNQEPVEKGGEAKLKMGQRSTIRAQLSYIFTIFIFPIGSFNWDTSWSPLKLNGGAETFLLE